MTKEQINAAINRVRDSLLLALHAAERDDFAECADHLEAAVSTIEKLGPPARRAA